MKSLKGKRVVFLVEDGYEDLECWYPKIRLEEEGVETVVVSRETGTHESKHGYPIVATHTPSDIELESIDGVVIPGGTGSPDKLRRSDEVTDLVRKVHEDGGLVAIICHAGWVPISAGILSGKRVTGYQAIKDDLINAGAQYEDKPIVRDENLISSRHPGDLPDFAKGIVEALSSR
ncbi:type 1 glutamine amidotransferase [Candidatus Bipolaricaulota bacterium]|nr:type 1 glutamine amidotransferase [Candidatus Bipolaricaulota bacterium]